MPVIFQLSWLHAAFKNILYWGETEWNKKKRFISFFFKIDVTVLPLHAANSLMTVFRSAFNGTPLIVEVNECFLDLIFQIYIYAIYGIFLPRRWQQLWLGASCVQLVHPSVLLSGSREPKHLSSKCSNQAQPNTDLILVLRGQRSRALWPFKWIQTLYFELKVKLANQMG